MSKAKKILVVEDNGDISLILDIMLNGKNLKLDYVNTIAKAKDFLKEHHPDLIVLDNKLPDGWGVDYLKEIKAADADQKVLMISGLEITESKAIENGADIFLPKPFNRQQVYDSVEKLLN